MPTVFYYSILAIFLSTIAPTIALISVNIDLFSNRQMKNSLLLITGIATVISGLFLFLGTAYIYPFAAATFDAPSSVIELIACAISLGIFFFLSERTFRELIKNTSTQIYTVVSVSAFFLLTTYFASILIYDFLMAGYVLISSFDFHRNIKEKQHFNLNSSEDVKELREDIVEFKKKPNVYVLFLESFHSGEALKSLYDIDNAELCDSLRNNDFTLYDNVFSNRQNTIHSFTCMACPNYLFNPDTLALSEDRSQSKVLSTFAANGYSLNLISEDFLKVRFAKLFDCYESESSAVGMSIHKSFAPLLAQSALLRNLMSTKDFFESTPQFEKLHNELQSRIIGGKDQPQLHWFHFGACHSPFNSWDKLEGFEEEYRPAYLKAEKELKKTVSTIKALDPDPLIIAVGDHGAHRYRYIDADAGKNPNEVIRSRGQEPELIAKDFFSVFLGIHWPVDHYSAGETMSHVRIFDHVFAALSEDRSQLKDLMPNISIASVREYGQAIAVRDGVPLKEWKPASKGRQISFLVNETQKNPKDITTHLCLVAKYYEVGERDAGAAYSLSLCKLFPDSEEVHTEASKRMIAKKDLKTAEKLARTALKLNPTSGGAHYCLAQIADQTGRIDEHDDSIQKTFQYDENYLFVRNACLRYGSVLLRHERYEDMNRFFNTLSPLEKIHFEHFVDWQIQYRLYVNKHDTRVFEWLDDKIHTAKSQEIKLAMLTRKIIVCIKAQRWEEAAKAARDTIDTKETYSGAYLTLAYCQEKMGQLDDALHTLLSGAQVAKSNAILEYLGTFVSRHKVREPSLIPLKVMAQNLLREKSAQWQQLVQFDADWYAAEYKELLGGLPPIEHYMQYATALMLNPNKEFDTAYYYSTHTEVFEHAVDASLHYTQSGKFDESRPHMTCIFDPTVNVNADWRPPQPPANQ